MNQAIYLSGLYSIFYLLQADNYADYWSLHEKDVIAVRVALTDVSMKACSSQA
jgi:hypothetical protein